MEDEEDLERIIADAGSFRRPEGEAVQGEVWGGPLGLMVTLSLGGVSGLLEDGE